MRRNQYAFGYLIASHRPLYEICDQNNIVSSRFWNIFGMAHTLGLFRKDEAEMLIRVPMKRSLNVTVKNTNAVLSMTGYQPALIQMVMDKYWTALSGKYRPNRDRIIHELRPYYHDMWQRRTKEEWGILIRLAAGKDVESCAALQDLKFRGLIDNGKPFSPLFADLIPEFYNPDDSDANSGDESS